MPNSNIDNKAFTSNNRNYENRNRRPPERGKVHAF